MLQFAVD